MSNNKELDGIGDYVSTLLKTNGVSAVTVSDGVVFTFTKAKLQQIIDSVGDAENVAIFVKSSAQEPTN
jgi:hypothetical protein